MIYVERGSGVLGHDQDALRPGETRCVDIRISGVFTGPTPSKPIIVQITVTDQLGNEYRLPKSPLRVVVPEPQKAVQPIPDKPPSTTKVFAVRVTLPSDVWEVIVEFSGDLAKNNSEDRLGEQASYAAIDALNRRWEKLNPNGPELTNFTYPNLARDVSTKDLTGRDVSSLTSGAVHYQLTVDLRVWIINGPT